MKPDITAEDYLKQLRETNTSCLYSEHELISYGHLMSKEKEIKEKPDFKTVELFEQKIAEYFNAPAAVAVDSCTHGIELVLRLKNAGRISCPRNTYLSVPMLANKLNINLEWKEEYYNWKDYYSVHSNLLDAAVYWKRDGFIKDTFMCISFQHQKHLSLGRGGMILCWDEQLAKELKKMSYDGREPGIPWREQNVSHMGYHYYMTPETAQKGLDKLEEAINTTPRIWTIEDWPDISKMEIFNKKQNQ